MRIVITLFALALGVASASAAVLSGSDLKDKIVGKTCTWTNGKMSGTSSYLPDGSAKLNGPENIAGTWRIKGNQLCDKFKERDKGKESCFTFDETAPGTFKGSIGFTATCN